MASFSNWLKRRIAKYDLFLEYFATLRQTWADVAWGTGVPAVGFIIWWSLGTIPQWAIALFFVWALIVAGYFSWRVDHVRLLPKFEVREFRIQETPTEGLQRRVYVQLLPQCLTDASVKECQGNLLRVFRRIAADSGWDLTSMNEPLPLEWSYHGADPLTLKSGIDQRLNVCYRVNDLSMLIPAVAPLPSRWRDVFKYTGTFRFDIRITAEDCEPVDVSIAVSLDDCEWNKPTVTLLS